jgi:hypothetical protein
MCDKKEKYQMFHVITIWKDFHDKSNFNNFYSSNEKALSRLKLFHFQFFFAYFFASAFLNLFWFAAPFHRCLWHLRLQFTCKWSKFKRKSFENDDTLRISTTPRLRTTGIHRTKQFLVQVSIALKSDNEKWKKIFFRFRCQPKLNKNVTISWASGRLTIKLQYIIGWISGSQPFFSSRHTNMESIFGGTPRFWKRPK